MFRHGDSSHLPERVVRLLSLDEDVRRRMCADLRRAVVEQHGLDRLWDRLVDVFQRLTKCWRNENAVSPVFTGKFCCTSLRSFPANGGLARMMSKRSASWMSARFWLRVLVRRMFGASIPCRIRFMIPMMYASDFFFWP